MVVHLKYNSNINKIEFEMWVKHYSKTDIDFRFSVNDKDLVTFNNTYNNLAHLVNNIPKNSIELSEKDFLFTYDKDANDCMILCYNIGSDFIKQSTCIGRVFYVPVNNCKKYTTFEIPDFIIYKHGDHTNYTINGLKINGGRNISSNLVCLSLNISKVANAQEYYDNNILIMDTGIYRAVIGQNIYISYSMNVLINKSKKYGIIWYSKCGCSTIVNIFCEVNNINIIKENMRTLNFHKSIYRYNVYLQNINFISFVRNPYHRFISSFIDKNVDHVDNIFLQIEGYMSYINIYKTDTMSNLCDYLLNNGYITEHYTLMCKYEYVQRLKTKVCKIEDNLNDQLLNFLKKYHDDLDIDFVKTCRENINSHMKKELIKSDNSLLLESESKERIDMNNYDFISYTRLDWLKYLKSNKLDYKKLLQNTKLKEMIYKVYYKDFIKFNYQE